MDEIKRIPSLEFTAIAVEHPFDRSMLAKDYYLTLILYLIKNVSGIYFKGGTAINKILLNQPRLSEDIDFSLTRSEKEVQKEILSILNKTSFFEEITEGKKVDGFLRMIVYYNSELGEGNIFIDLNKRAKFIVPAESHNINHFYSPFIPQFSVKTLGKEELIAEKVAASIGRNKPRDHFDVYQIINSDMPINMEMVKKKCADSGDEFSIIKMFNKAQTLKNRWDKDMTALLAEPISFQKVIQFLANYFKLKEEKENVKNKEKR